MAGRVLSARDAESAALIELALRESGLLFSQDMQLDLFCFLDILKTSLNSESFLFLDCGRRSCFSPNFSMALQRGAVDFSLIYIILREHTQARACS
jgi:hypothetical protein